LWARPPLLLKSLGSRRVQRQSESQVSFSKQKYLFLPVVFTVRTVIIYSVGDVCVEVCNRMCLCTSVMYKCDGVYCGSEGPFVPDRLQAFSPLQGRLGGCKPPKAPATQRRRSLGWSIGSLRLLFVVPLCLRPSLVSPWMSFRRAGRSRRRWIPPTVVLLA